tara:strand:+ start:1060 stop:2055 length:996 start_codon:yes stop_codon:yes gene_type:complete
LEQHQVNRIFENFHKLKALVIGDVMIDAYYWGKTERISPEAPVPIVSVSHTENRLGGAANVALNVKALGAKAILCAAVGNDLKADLLESLLDEEHLDKSGIVRLDDRVTTVKTRVISQHQHLLRVDEEMTTPLNQSDTEQLYQRIVKLVDEQTIDVIVFEDYDKGVITPELIDKVVALANDKNIPITVDPKKAQFLDYKGVTLFKPNLKELREGLKVEIGKVDLPHLDEAVELLRKKMPFEMALITLSQHGVYIHDGKSSTIIPAHLRNIADVSGAGDTVISVASLCLALDTEPEITARLANLAGGLVCEKVGVVPVDAELLKEEALRISK